MYNISLLLVDSIDWDWIHVHVMRDFPWLLSQQSCHPLRRLTSHDIALEAFGLLLERAHELARHQDTMPRVENINTRDIPRQLQTALNGT